MILRIPRVSVLSGAAERNCKDRKLGKTPARPLPMARCLLLPAQRFPFPPENKAAVIASTHKMQGIPSAEISGNFTRTQITLVCRVQHCLEREQQTFPLEASFLFRAVYGRGAVSDCGTNTLSAFGLEDKTFDTSFCCRNTPPRPDSQHGYFLKHYVIGLHGQ